MNATIDLNEYRSPGVHVFTGRERGARVRDASRIDALLTDADIISIIVPEDVYSINPSFLEEMLRGVVSKIGREEFHKKFQFINNGQWKIEKNLDNAIERILRIPEYDWELKPSFAKIASSSGLEKLSSAKPQEPDLHYLKAWMKIYKPPFHFDPKSGTTIFDAENNMVCQVRGWGRISYHNHAEEMQDAFGHWLAQRITQLYTEKTI